ncbi:TonB-dependent receptor [Acinetobacter radioresistens]|uniref:TonB-dependent receptor n=1 Tax=Acinetobacter radioresistens TaxID=40216 RepID=UPI000E736B12|nr:TonB-dependent receptor [Acinetobacter radioresistens]RJL69999.1 TonB-dependent receptor [Acinetobacter radioresistens]
MKYSSLMTLILVVIQQAQAEENITNLDPLILQADHTEENITVVDKERIESANTLGEALKHISGVQSTSFGPNSGAPVIRSLTGNRVGILENGQSINGMNAISGDINIPFDPLFTKNITVHKGTNSVRYGGNSIGGSIDIDTGIISKELEDKSRNLDIVYKKGFNDFEAQGIRLNLNNQKNLSTNIQFSTQDISSYKIPGKSKAAVCDTDIFPAIGGINSALANVCQKDSRILKNFNKSHHKYLNKHVLEDIAKNPENFYDYYDGLESAKYTNEAVSKRYVNGSLKEFINDPNPDYLPDTDEYTENKINNDVTPNYEKKLDNSYARNENMAIGTTYFLNNGYIGISADYKTSDYGVPGFSMENKSFQNSYSDGLPVGVKIKQNRFTVDSLFRQPLSFINKVQLKASSLSNTSGEYIGSRKANEYKFDTDAAELLFEHIPYKNLSGEIGTSLNKREVKGSGAEGYLPNVNTDTHAFFIQEKLAFNKLFFDTGYRLEKVEHRIQDQNFKLSRNASNTKLEDRSFSLNSFYVGAEYRPTNDLGFRLQYSESERAPEINELYASNPHYSVMTQEEGNQNLNKEKMQGLEFITDFNLDSTDIVLSLYQMDFENYLYLSHSGASMRNRLPLKYWKQTDTKVNGFEVDINHTFSLNKLGDLKVGGFADFVKNKATDPDRLRLANDGIYLPNMPTNRYGANIEWKLEDWSARLSSIYYDKPRYLGKNVSEEIPLPAYNLVDLDISKKVLLKNASFDLFINGSNLLNEDARPHNSPLKYIAPLPGRAFQLGITMHI